MVQLNEVATQVKSRIETVLTKIKSPDDPNSTSTSSQSPRPTSSESLNHQTAKVVDAVFNTLFGACTGNGNLSCSSPQQSQNDKSHIILNRKFQTNHKKKSISKQNLQKTTSNIESKYAQYYQDDHGLAARAVLMASEREEKEKLNRRQKWNFMNKRAKEEAAGTNVTERSRQRRNIMRTNNNDHGGEYYGQDGNYPVQERRGNVPFSENHKREVPQHREQMEVNGSPFILAEVPPHESSIDIENGSESGVSYDYDDGVSALSAHTLEEMAKIDAMLQNKKRMESEPQEQGFDISMEKLNISNGDTTITTAEATGMDSSASKSESGDENGEGSEPPSPVGTEQSHNSCNQDLLEYDYNYDIDEEDNFNAQQSNHGQYTPTNKQKYPAQTARNNAPGNNIINNTEDSNASNISSSSFNNSSSQLSERWRTSDQKYWSQLVEEDVKSPTIKNSSSIPQKSKTKKLRRLFGRKNIYMACDEFDDAEYEI